VFTDGIRDRFLAGNPMPVPAENLIRREHVAGEFLFRLPQGM
jgi:hypothetical protein